MNGVEYKEENKIVIRSVIPRDGDRIQPDRWNPLAWEESIEYDDTKGD